MTFRRARISFFLSAIIVAGLSLRAEGGELVYKNIAQAPPVGYQLVWQGCRPGFGQPWHDPSQGYSMQLGYHQGQLIAQQFLLGLNDMRNKKSWEDLKLVKGAQISRVTFGYGTGGPEPSYMVIFYYVDEATARKVCPSLTHPMNR